MTENDVKAMILDAQLHATAAGIRAVLPPWYIELTEAHANEVERLRNAGYLSAAVVLSEHHPLLDEAVGTRS